MVKTLLAALVLAAAAGAVPAHAGASSEFLGGCGFETRRDPRRPDVQIGTIHAEVVVFSRADDNPVSALVTCGFNVNGVMAWSETFEGTAAVVGRRLGEYRLGEFDSFTWCETVDFTSDDTPTSSACYYIDYTQLPPQEVYDVACPVVGAAACDAMADVFWTIFS